MKSEELIERLEKFGEEHFGKLPEHRSDLIVYEDPGNAQNWWCVDGVWHHLCVVRYRFFVNGIEVRR